MREFQDYELLSAYLDGELTAAEQAEVEKLLAADPRARQLIDEMRAIGTALQSLPPQKLAEDLSEQVLREAQRRIVLGTAEPGSADSSPRQTFGRIISRPWTLLSPRALLWTSIVLVVALALTLQERGWQRRRPAEHVAQLPQQAPPESEQPRIGGPMPSIHAPRAELAEKADGAARRKVDRMEGTVPESLREKLLEEERRYQALRAAVPPKVGPSLPGPNGWQVSPGMAGDLEHPDGGMREEGSKGGGRAEVVRQPSPYKPRDVAKLAEAPAGNGIGGIRVLRPAEMPAGEPGDACPVPHEAAPSKAAPYEADADKSVADKTAPCKATPDEAVPAEAALMAKKQQAVLVVHCDVTPQSIQEGVFARLLHGRGLVGKTTVAQTMPALKKADSPQLGKENDRKTTLEGLADQKEARASDREDGLAVLLVEATPAQLESILKEMAAQPRYFTRLSVEPAPSAPDQQALRRYSQPGGAPVMTQVVEEEKPFGVSGQGASELPAQRLGLADTRVKDLAEGKAGSDSKVAKGGGGTAASSAPTAAVPGPPKAEVTAHRVLFVLRVVQTHLMGDQPGVAAEKTAAPPAAAELTIPADANKARLESSDAPSGAGHAGSATRDHAAEITPAPPNSPPAAK